MSAWVYEKSAAGTTILGILVAPFVVPTSSQIPRTTELWNFALLVPLVETRAYRVTTASVIDSPF